jgi:hypothetical protein
MTSHVEIAEMTTSALITHRNHRILSGALASLIEVAARVRATQHPTSIGGGGEVSLLLLLGK